MSDQESMVKKYGPWFDYNQSPRAQIFKRNQSKVVDLASMMKMMRLVKNPAKVVHVQEECLQFDCTVSNTGATRDDHYWTFKKNSVELIELSSRS